MKMKIKSKVSMLLLLSVIGSLAQASELTYTPMNPSFGGSVSNGVYLLSQASAQKQFEEKQDEDTPLEQFNDRLQRALLSRITSAITRDVVDINGNVSPGVFETVDYTIEIIDEGNGIMTIITIDKVSGEETIIQVENEL